MLLFLGRNNLRTLFVLFVCFFTFGWVCECAVDLRINRVLSEISGTQSQTIDDLSKALAIAGESRAYTRPNNNRNRIGIQ